VRTLPAFHSLAVTKDIKMTGSIIVSPYAQDDYFMHLDTLTKKMIEMIKERKVNIPSWLVEFTKIPKTSNEEPLMKGDLIKCIIDYPINVISLVFNLDSKSLYKIKTSYINSVIASFITNQNKLDTSSCGIITNKELNNVSLIPIYNYNNNLEIPKVFIINSKHIDSSALINTLFSEYYPFFKDMVRGLNENISAYKKSISLIVENNTSKNISKIILRNIFDRLDLVTSLEEESRLNHGESRIDMVCTQTSINLNAVNRNQEVRDKYEVGETEVFEEIKEEEMVKVIEKKELESDPTKKIRLVVIVILILIVLAVIFLLYYYFKFMRN